MKPSSIVAVGGLGYGDEGKGGIVDFLVGERKACAVVRYSGGAQAAHNVVLDDGRHHTFSQFGSGAFHGAKTFLSRYMLVNPISIYREAFHLNDLLGQDPFRTLYLARRALVTTPFHVAANRLREIARNAGRHGSCGMGIGETMAYYLRFGVEAPILDDILFPRRFEAKTDILRRRLVEELGALDVEALGPAAKHEWAVLTSEPEVSWVASELRELVKLAHVVDDDFLDNLIEEGPVVFEGAQGALLHEDLGFQPYTTWTDTSFRNVDRLVREVGREPAEVERIGVLRTYASRHGAGPFMTEASLVFPEAHNQTHPYQGSFRHGYFDAVATRYGAAIMGPLDGIALTHMDYLPKRARNRVCTGYGLTQPDAALFTTTGDPLHATGLIPGDLAHQERLTATLLSSVNPRYQWLTSPEELVALVEELTHAPVSLFSYGPTRGDKRPNKA